MATTSWKSPGTLTSATRSGGTVSWINPGSVGNSDNAYATATLAANSSHWLWCTNFGFTESDVPAGATINGFEIQWERKATYGFATEDTTIQSFFKAIVAGAEAGTQKTVTEEPTGTDTYSSQGGAADLWGRTYTQAETIASDTGIAIARNDIKYASEVCSVDHVQIRWHYTAASSFSNKLSSYFLVFSSLLRFIGIQV